MILERFLHQVNDLELADNKKIENYLSRLAEIGKDRPIDVHCYGVTDTNLPKALEWLKLARKILIR